MKVLILIIFIVSITQGTPVKQKTLTIKLLENKKPVPFRIIKHKHHPKFDYKHRHPYKGPAYPPRPIIIEKEVRVPVYIPPHAEEEVQQRPIIVEKKVPYRVEVPVEKPVFVPVPKLVPVYIKESPVPNQHVNLLRPHSYQEVNHKPSFNSVQEGRFLRNQDNTNVWSSSGKGNFLNQDNKNIWSSSGRGNIVNNNNFAKNPTGWSSQNPWSNNGAPIAWKTTKAWKNNAWSNNGPPIVWKTQPAPNPWKNQDNKNAWSNQNAWKNIGDAKYVETTTSDLSEHGWIPMAPILEQSSGHILNSGEAVVKQENAWNSANKSNSTADIHQYLQNLNPNFQLGEQHNNFDQQFPPNVHNFNQNPSEDLNEKHNHDYNNQNRNINSNNHYGEAFDSYDNHNVGSTNQNHQNYDNQDYENYDLPNLNQNVNFDGIHNYGNVNSKHNYANFNSNQNYGNFDASQNYGNTHANQNNYGPPEINSDYNHRAKNHKYPDEYSQYDSYGQMVNYEDAWDRPRFAHLVGVNPNSTENTTHVADKIVKKSENVQSGTLEDHPIYLPLVTEQTLNRSAANNIKRLDGNNHTDVIESHEYDGQTDFSYLNVILENPSAQSLQHPNITNTRGNFGYDTSSAHSFQQHQHETSRSNELNQSNKIVNESYKKQIANEDQYTDMKYYNLENQEYEKYFHEHEVANPEHESPQNNQHFHEHEVANPEHESPQNNQHFHEHEIANPEYESGQNTQYAFTRENKRLENPYAQLSKEVVEQRMKNEEYKKYLMEHGIRESEDEKQKFEQHFMNQYLQQVFGNNYENLHQSKENKGYIVNNLSGIYENHNEKYTNAEELKENDTISNKLKIITGDNSQKYNPGNTEQDFKIKTEDTSYEFLPQPLQLVGSQFGYNQDETQYNVIEHDNEITDDSDVSASNVNYYGKPSTRKSDLLETFTGYQDDTRKVYTTRKQRESVLANERYPLIIKYLDDDDDDVEEKEEENKNVESVVKEEEENKIVKSVDEKISERKRGVRKWSDLNHNEQITETIVVNKQNDKNLESNQRGRRIRMGKTLSDVEAGRRISHDENSSNDKIDTSHLNKESTVEDSKTDSTTSTENYETSTLEVFTTISDHDVESSTNEVEYTNTHKQSSNELSTKLVNNYGKSSERRTDTSTENNKLNSFDSNPTEENNSYNSVTAESNKLNSFYSNPTEENNSYNSVTAEINKLNSHNYVSTDKIRKNSYNSIPTKENKLNSYNSVRTEENKLNSYNSVRIEENKLNSYNSVPTEENKLNSHNFITTEDTKLNSYTEDSRLNSHNSDPTEENKWNSHNSVPTENNKVNSYNSDHTEDNKLNSSDSNSDYESMLSKGIKDLSSLFTQIYITEVFNNNETKTGQLDDEKSVATTTVASKVTVDEKNDEKTTEASNLVSKRRKMRGRGNKLYSKQVESTTVSTTQASRNYRGRRRKVEKTD